MDKGLPLVGIDAECGGCSVNAEPIEINDWLALYARLEIQRRRIKESLNLDPIGYAIPARMLPSGDRLTFGCAMTLAGLPVQPTEGTLGLIYGVDA